jgi:integrase
MPASPDTLNLFVTAQLRDFKVATVDRRLSGIKAAHKAAGHELPPLPKCRELMVSMRQRRHERPQGKKSLDVKDLVRICRKLGDTNAGVRDRAVLVFGFATGLRRSEIARLDLADVQVSSKGIVIDVKWSKTDQQAKGRTFAIFAGKRECTDPVRTMRAWIAARGKEQGPLFTRVQTGDIVTLQRLAGESVNEVVHRAVKRIGLDPTQYGAHSLRAGLVTTAADAGASDREIMRASGHRSVQVMSRYVRHSRAYATRNVLAGAL